MLDCADHDRFGEARKEFQKVVENKDMRRAAVLIFANKQDQKHAIKATEVPAILGLDKMTDRAWFVQPSCASKGTGLDTGLNWLIENSGRTNKSNRRNRSNILLHM